MSLTPLTQAPNFGTVAVAPKIAYPATLPASTGTWNSDLLPAGRGTILAAVKSDQAGTITIQRYADLAGLVPIGALASSTLVANTPNSVSIVDGVPCLSFVVTINNTGGSIANITNTAILVGPPPL